jgi:hypothetical protein
LAHRVVAALENAGFEAEAGREAAVVGRAEAHAQQDAQHLAVLRLQREDGIKAGAALFDEGRRIDGSGIFYAGDCADCGQELIG